MQVWWTSREEDRSILHGKNIRCKSATPLPIEHRLSADSRISRRPARYPEMGESVPVARAGLQEGAQNSRRLPGILPQDAAEQGIVARKVGHALAPIILDKLLRNLCGGDRERITAAVPLL